VYPDNFSVVGSLRAMKKVKSLLHITGTKKEKKEKEDKKPKKEKEEKKKNSNNEKGEVEEKKKKTNQFASIRLLQAERYRRSYQREEKDDQRSTGNNKNKR